MTHDRLFHRFNKSLLCLRHKDPRYPLKPHWRYKNAVYEAYRSPEVVLTFLKSDDLVLPDPTSEGDLQPFDPSPELPVLCFEGHPVDGMPIGLKEKLAMGNYQTYMQQKFGWLPATWRNID